MKKFIAKEILSTSVSIDGRFLETSLADNSINIDQYKSI